MASRNPDRVGQAVAALPGAVGFPDCDVRSPARVAALFEFVHAHWGRLDIVVHSAGIGRASSSDRLLPAPVTALPEEEWDAVMETNLRGAFLVCRAAARAMVAQRRGQILNVSSARGAVRGHAFGAAYCASKMAVRVLFQCLASELAPFNVRVLSFLPDAVDTPLLTGTKLARHGAMTPEEVGEFVAHMLTAPLDLVVEEPLVLPLGGRSGKRRPGGEGSESHA